MPVRVLAVDDSVLFRTKIQLTLSKDPDIKIVGTAVDADDALRKILELKPDVVTLDVEMPKMSGIEFMKTLMKQHPVAVVVVSSLPMNAIDAMSAGAVDFVKKPSEGSSAAVDAFFTELAEKVKVAAGTRSGRVLRVKGKGVEAKAGAGDLLAKVQVVVPQRLSDEAKEAVEALRRQEDGVDPRAELFTKAQA